MKKVLLSTASAAAILLSMATANAADINLDVDAVGNDDVNLHQDIDDTDGRDIDFGQTGKVAVGAGDFVGNGSASNQSWDMEVNARQGSSADLDLKQDIEDLTADRDIDGGQVGIGAQAAGTLEFKLQKSHPAGLRVDADIRADQDDTVELDQNIDDLNADRDITAGQTGFGAYASLTGSVENVEGNGPDISGSVVSVSDDSVELDQDIEDLTSGRDIALAQAGGSAYSKGQLDFTKGAGFGADVDLTVAATANDTLDLDQHIDEIDTGRDFSAVQNGTGATAIGGVNATGTQLP